MEIRDDTKSRADQLVDPDNFYALPPKFYSERYTFFGHRQGGSWYGSDVAFVLWVLARPLIIALCAFTLLVSSLMVALRRQMFSAVRGSMGRAANIESKQKIDLQENL